MRLTAELIQNSLSFLNPLKERELDLRGHRINGIENLAVAGPQDAIDFTDNDIAHLSNFPLSPRLHTLLLSRNRLVAIQSTLATNIPNLTTLILTANSFTELADLDPLRHFSKLTHLSLVENPVARKEHYRYYLIWRFPHVRFLDYQKVRDVERAKAAELFGSIEEPSALASKIMGMKSVGSASAAEGGNGASYSELAGAAAKASRLRLTDKEKEKMRELIKSAKTVDEVLRLEKYFAEGRAPREVMEM